MSYLAYLITIFLKQGIYFIDIGKTNLFTKEYWFQNLQIFFLLFPIYQKYLGRWKHLICWKFSLDLFLVSPADEIAVVCDEGIVLD